MLELEGSVDADLGCLGGGWVDLCVGVIDTDIIKVLENLE